MSQNNNEFNEQFGQKTERDEHSLCLCNRQSSHGWINDTAGCSLRPSYSVCRIE